MAQPRKHPEKQRFWSAAFKSHHIENRGKKYAKKGLDPFAFATLIALLCACSDTAQQPETEKPKIRIGGTTYAPYFYRNIGGHYTGIDVEIAEEACARIGYEPIFVELDIDKGFELLNEDYVDCLWCCLTMEGNEDMYNTLVYLQTMKSYTPQYTRMVDWWKNETSENMAVHRLSVPQYVQAIDLDWSEKLEVDYLEVPDTVFAGIAARPFHDLPFHRLPEP